MSQILLHKQELTEEQVAKLQSEGVIAIRTDNPEDFHFLDVRVPQIQLDDMVWCCVDALSNAANSGFARLKFVENLTAIATEGRKRRNS